MNENRERQLATLPVTERRVDCAGIDTPVLEGGDGAPVVLLHGPGGSAMHWARVIPEMAMAHALVVPDLPGQGESRLDGEPLDAERVIAWLDELIDRTCASPPALVGYALGGAIAARYACERSERLSALVLVDTLGLVDFAPAPNFGAALQAFLAEPTGANHDRLWHQCTLDLDGVRTRLGERWQPFKAYNLERAQTPSVKAALGTLMGVFGLPAIAPEDLGSIAAPTSLIWGRHDLATRLADAETASERYGWPLQVIDDCGSDPPIEQPEALVDALQSALGARTAEAR